ncbi:MAG: bifunctional folylpolyglutamate synthase/dihydrofolate synthase, partial [Endomicrobiales bacterium]|nr:bifunctional folylpolyglutamate synthase/dihydrofolate synthase [Endomicrobiales bacterium]
AGYRTGLYVSPHLLRVNERIRVNSKEIPDGVLARLCAKYHRLSKKCGLTYFEFITAVAFAYFKEKKADVAVIETGLGGRFDATNVVTKPLVSVITSIGLDHKHVLGNTISKVAREKAGIIKENCRVIAGVVSRDALQVIRNQARRKDSPLETIKRDFDCRVLKVDWKKGVQRVLFKGSGGRNRYSLSLLGRHQAENCALALECLEILKKNGFNAGKADVKKALNSVSWPGRFEILKRGRKKPIILDGAHNPDAARTLVETLKQSPWGKQKITVVFGALADKDYKKMISVLAPVTGSVISVPVNSARSVDPVKLKEEWQKHIMPEFVDVSKSLREVLEDLKNGEAVLVTGSLYLVGEALKILIKRGKNGKHVSRH